MYQLVIPISKSNRIYLVYFKTLRSFISEHGHGDHASHGSEHGSHSSHGVDHGKEHGIHGSDHGKDHGSHGSEHDHSKHH